MKHLYYLCLVAFFMIPTKGSCAPIDDDMIINTNPIQRVRINVTTPNGFVRHLLLAFTSNNAATDGFDYGYDAINSDNYENDCSWMIGQERYNIQGVGAFQNTKAYPLGLFLSDAGDVEFTLTSLEHFNETVDVYIYDALHQTTTSISNSSFIKAMPEGDITNRFYVTFTSSISAIVFSDSTLSEKDSTVETPKISYINSTKELQISAVSSLRLEQINLYNILGQSIKQRSNFSSNHSGEYKISLANITKGTYIVSLKTETGKYSKRLIISN